jgi:multidrug efflux pump subunit AcrA (membrane-fusion protein)
MKTREASNGLDMKPHTQRIGMALAAVVLIAASAAWYRSRSGDSGVAYQTAWVTRGALRVTISATGTVEPEEVIDVGAQVAGQILSFGRDVNGQTVDYGSKVAAGTVLANIDDSLYAAEATIARAQVQSAQAGLERAEADLAQFKAKLDQAERDWVRAKKLGPSEALAQTSYDAYRSAYDTAKANAPQYRETGAPAAQTGSPEAGERRPEATESGQNSNGRPAVLWIPEGAYVRPVAVHTGAGDGFRTVVAGEGLSEGMPVVTGMQTLDAETGDTRNPFAPQFPRRSRNPSRKSQ